MTPEPVPSRVCDEAVAYMLAMHEMVAAYHQRLGEVTSPRVATQFLGNVADMTIRSFGVSKEDTSSQAMEKVKSIAAELGVNIKTFNVGNDMSCQVTCSFAPIIHPKLMSKNPICPILVLTLGAARKKHRDATIPSLTLAVNGSQCTISSEPT